MTTTSFKSTLEQRLLDVAAYAAGPASGLPNTVVTFDDHLDNLDQSQLPCAVFFTLSKSKDPEGQEISRYGNWVWHCQGYYLDTTSEDETWDTGKDRRDMLVGALTDVFEGNHFLTTDTLGPLSDIDLKGVTESVWQVDITTVTFDQSGQSGYYTFVSEILLDVHTNKN